MEKKVYPEWWDREKEREKLKEFIKSDDDIEAMLDKDEKFYGVDYYIPFNKPAKKPTQNSDSKSPMVYFAPSLYDNTQKVCDKISNLSTVLESNGVYSVPDAIEFYEMNGVVAKASMEEFNAPEKTQFLGVPIPPYK